MITKWDIEMVFSPSGEKVVYKNCPEYGFNATNTFVYVIEKPEPMEAKDMESHAQIHWFNMKDIDSINLVRHITFANREEKKGFEKAQRGEK